ncbi:MAG: NAD(P)/FAD-dependent oxidoreductase [Planctomycetota bacterium]|jgi:flavin-dependent dehydrogenase
MTVTRDEESYDAIVIGGGPAGATVGALLAEAGRRVLIVEKGRFPRYSVGESLLPACYGPLKRLGVLPRMETSSFVEKHSVQFVSTDGRASQPFYFADHMDHPSARTWQVDRAEFDQLLLDNARAKGAAVMEGAGVKDLLVEDDCVVGVTVNGEAPAMTLRARVVIDASGRDALSIKRLGWRERDEALERIAIWTYYRGAKRDTGRDEGTTTVAYLPEKGWFWYIPLQRDVVSVGVVAREQYLYRNGRDPAAIFAREVAQNPWIAERLAAGVQEGPFRVTGDYSYRARHCAMDGLVLVGDAFSFVDPVFSSGVFLALLGGERCADAVEAALEAGDVSAARFSAYGQSLCAAIEPMRRLIYAFYDPAFNFGKLLRAHPELRADVTDCLIGHVERDFTALWAAAGELTDVPATLQHGTPLCRVET